MSNSELLRANLPVKVLSFRSTLHRAVPSMVRITLAQPVSTTFLAEAAAPTAASEETEEEEKKSRYVERTFEARKQDAKIDPPLGTQFGAGRLYAAVLSRRGPVGRADGYIFEGKELEVRFIITNLRLH